MSLCGQSVPEKSQLQLAVLKSRTHPASHLEQLRAGGVGLCHPLPCGPMQILSAIWETSWMAKKVLQLGGPVPCRQWHLGHFSSTKEKVELAQWPLTLHRPAALCRTPGHSNKTQQDKSGSQPHRPLPHSVLCLVAKELWNRAVGNRDTCSSKGACPGWGRTALWQDSPRVQGFLAL